MACSIFPEVLTVGLAEKAQELGQLPIQVVHTETGMQAVQVLRSERNVHGLVSRWDLPDLKDGEFIRRIRFARPGIPVIVLLNEPSEEREIAARSLGIAALFPNAVAGSLLRAAILQLIGLDTLDAQMHYVS